MVRRIRLARDHDGGISLEAAVLMPFFLAFVFLLILLVKIAIADMAVKSAAVEATKMVATHLYPVELLVEEAKQKFGESKIGSGLNELLARVESMQGKLERTEQFVDDYAAWIPEPFVRLVKWEKELRESMASQTGNGWQEYLQPKINEAMKPIVTMFADAELLDFDRLDVVHVDWPSLSNRDQAFLGVELQYRFPIHLPFYRLDFIIKKKAYERVWLGA